MGRVKKMKIIEGDDFPPNENFANVLIGQLKTTDKTNLDFEKFSFQKKNVFKSLRAEYEFISKYFDVLELAKLSKGNRNDSEEEDENTQFYGEDVSEEKSFKKQTQKKGASQAPAKRKAFPSTIEGLEKELEELKGAPLSYQNALRKKGLLSRIRKKKRKELLRQTKGGMKSSKKSNSPVNGLSKVKPILNSDGNIVSNKFDFADTDSKKENKKKTGNQNVNQYDGNLNKNAGKLVPISFKPISLSVKKENEGADGKNDTKNDESKPSLQKGPVFNKDNKIMFSKVFIPESHKKATSKVDKDPKKILKKLKEETKKISELEKEDEERASSLKEKQKWMAALKRASGEKVRDDPELLKKTIAKEKNKKMRSQKKWKARTEHIEKEREERQKKRKENLQARKTENKKKKMKKAIKKGSYVPL